MAEAQFWLSPGTIVGRRYEIQDVLGIGGYGITYRGIDSHLERFVAIKEFFPSFWAARFVERGLDIHCLAGMEGNYAKGKERFLDEARTLVQLSSIPAIVRVNDYFEENGTAYLVMDFLDGKHLKQVADGFGGRIPADVLLPVMEPVILALKQVHAKGMIHRDISPDNIMMLEDGSVRLIDFGNARDTTDDRSMTMAMKQGFAAPEQYRSKGQGSWTDVYGICATMYYCLTGKLPPQALERLTGAPFPTPREMGVQIDPEKEQVILEGLELYVNRRIQNMEDLHERLYPKQPVYVPPVTPQPPVPEAPEIRTTILQPVAEQEKKEELPELEQKVVAGIGQIRNLCSKIFKKLKEL